MLLAGDLWFARPLVTASLALSLKDISNIFKKIDTYFL